MNGASPMISTTPPFVLRFSKDERKVFSRIKYQFDLASVNGRFPRRLLSNEPPVRQSEISDCAAAIVASTARVAITDCTNRFIGTKINRTEPVEACSRTRPQTHAPFR